ATTDAIVRHARNRPDGVSVGGMATKLQAARKAAASGVPMIIASGREPGALGRILAGEPVGTYFAPKAERLAARKRWIAFAVPPQGRLTVDAGALAALTRHKKSLLPAGVVEVEGDFASGEVVAVHGAGARREDRRAPRGQPRRRRARPQPRRRPRVSRPAGAQRGARRGDGAGAPGDRRAPRPGGHGRRVLAPSQRPRDLARPRPARGDR